MIRWPGDTDGDDPLNDFVRVIRLTWTLADASSNDGPPSDLVRAARRST
jgi:hypothetical protein